VRNRPIPNILQQLRKLTAYSKTQLIAVCEITSSLNSKADFNSCSAVTQYVYGKRIEKENKAKRKESGVG
jgi:hypothetical protein